MRLRFMVSLVALFALTALPAIPASAGIRCVDGFQIVNGARIATPYCQDLLVYKVAREYGVKTTASAIRNNPNHKRHVCAFIGRDIRVYHACIDANSVGRRVF